MVRTKADRVPTKAVGSKAPGKISTGTPGKKSGRKGTGKSYGGGNPYHPRETPEWQKPITSFINMSSKTTASNITPTKEKIVSNSNSEERNAEKSAPEEIENQASNFNCEDPNAEESTSEEDDETD